MGLLICAAAITIVTAVLGCGGGSEVAMRSKTVPARSRAQPTPVHRSDLGRSALGREIRVVESGDPASRRSVLVVGCIHGTETAGVAVTRQLMKARPPAHEQLWVMNYLNPDGAAKGSRVNAHGVDLNRNFPWRWRPIYRPGDLQYSGPRSASDPETRIAMRLIERIRPTVTIWFHQPVGIVRAFGQSARVARRFARLAGLPFRLIPWLSGSASNWENHRLPRAASFVVELPPGPLSRAGVTRYIRAIRALAG